jgi:hypothetical protein
MPFGIIAITGLAHLHSNHGLAYEVSKDDNGKWRATKWKALPGAPTSSALLEDGNLLVDCRGGSVVISTDGKIEMARNMKMK